MVKVNGILYSSFTSMKMFKFNLQAQISGKKTSMNAAFFCNWHCKNNLKNSDTLKTVS